MRKIFAGLWAVVLVAGGLLLLASAAMAGAPKVNVCHLPPGNPANVQSIWVGAAAEPAHLAHGDYVVGDEVCDGIDNDCNGIPDDGGACDGSLLTCQCVGGEPIEACIETEAGCRAYERRCTNLCDGDVAAFSCDPIGSCQLTPP